LGEQRKSAKIDFSFQSLTRENTDLNKAQTAITLHLKMGELGFPIPDLNETAFHEQNFTVIE